MTREHKRIILSGGWGYGNLGDDAILWASYSLIKQKYPNSNITILSYNIKESCNVIPEGSDVDYQESLHVSMFGFKPHTLKLGEGFISELTKPIKTAYNRHVYKRIQDSLLRRKVLKNPDTFASKYNTQFDNFHKLCKTADIYVMSGGGYLSNWAEMVISKYYEVDIAKKHDLDIYIIGQTIGPYKYKTARLLAQRILQNVDCSFFRDAESIRDAKQLGAKCLGHVIPDLVLSTERTLPKENYIVFIPFLSDITKNKERIVHNLSSLAEKYNCSVYVTVSQLWPYGMQIGVSIYLELLAHHVDACYVIPHDYRELSDVLASAQMTFSQNLHGLILSYCAHTPVVSLNRRRKFVSFMESIGHPENILSLNSLSTTDFLSRYEKRQMFDFSKLSQFRKEIIDAINVITEK